MKIVSTISSILFLTLILSSAYALSGFKVPLSGDPSSTSHGDFNGDKLQDIALLIAKRDFSVSLLILWGNKTNPYSKSTEIQLDVQLEKSNSLPSFRGASSRALAVFDFNSDGRLDIGTSFGFAINKGKNQFTWLSISKGIQKPYQSVGVLKTNSKPFLIIRVDGGVNACHLRDCYTLFRSDLLNDELNDVSELIILDFDNDGVDDVLTGSRHLDPENSFVWLGKNQFTGSPVKLEGLGPIEIQVGDLNGDKRLDFFSQVNEYISDFPSSTKIFLNLASGLKLHKTFANYDNHNENSTLVKNSNGCFDYYQIGVDRGVGKISSQKRINGVCDFGPEATGFQEVSPQVGIGVQCLPIFKETCSLVIRQPLWPAIDPYLFIEN